MFHAGSNNPTLWFYPPWFWVISRTLAIFPFAQAQVGWRLLLAATLLGSVLLLGGRIARAAAREGVHPGAVWYCIAMLFFACTMRASVESLALGQMSHLVLLGLMLALVALLEERQWTGVVAIVLLAMKPQFALIVGLLKAGTISRIRTLAVAGFIITLLALPPIFVSGAEPAIGGFLKGIASYAAYDGTTLNQAVGMTGIRHLVFVLTGLELNPTALALVGGVIVLLISFLLYRRTQGTAERRRILGLVLLVMANFVSLHAYETVYVMPLILLMIGWPALIQLSIGFGLLVLYRSDMIADATGWWDSRSFFRGTAVDSVVLFTLLLIWVAALVRDHMAKRKHTFGCFLANARNKEAVLLGIGT